MFANNFLILQEALRKKENELATLQTAYEEKDKELIEMKESLSNMHDGESSQVSAELTEAKEKLAEANKQLLAQKEEIQELNAKQVFKILKFLCTLGKYCFVPYNYYYPSDGSN